MGPETPDTSRNRKLSQIFLDAQLPLLTQYEQPEGITYRLFRFPILILILLLLMANLILYFLLRLIVLSIEQIKAGLTQRLPEEIAVDNCTSYSEYKAAAISIDRQLKRESWKNDPRSSYYDYELIGSIVKLLHRIDNVQSIAEKSKQLRKVILESGIKCNIGGIYNHRLYAHTCYGSKKLIEKFSIKVRDSLLWLLVNEVDGREIKRNFFKQAARMYGRTCLCLSGGAMNGYYHFGVIKGLLEENCLPSIISGTSSGSVAAAFVCCRTESELKSMFENPQEMVGLVQPYDESLLSMFWRLVTTGAMVNNYDALQRLTKICGGELTFLEAYQRTGRILNVTVASEDSRKPSHVLNYRTTPHVVISSAVLASCAIPFFLEASHLISKEDDSSKLFRGLGTKWRDGSFRLDVPFEKLTQLFNTQYNIVCQVNPLIIPFFYERYGSAGLPSTHNNGLGFKGGFIASLLELWIKMDMRKWLYVLRHMFILPHWWGMDVSYFFLQPFQGTVTVHPFPRIIDYLSILTPPKTLDKFSYYVKIGEQMIWPKIYMIKMRMEIEKVMDAAMLELKSGSVESLTNIDY